MSISKVQNLSSILRQKVLWNENNDVMTIDFENEANILPIPYFPGIKFNIDIETYTKKANFSTRFFSYFPYLYV